MSSCSLQYKNLSPARRVRGGNPSTRQQGRVVRVRDVKSQRSREHSWSRFVPSVFCVEVYTNVCRDMNLNSSFVSVADRRMTGEHETPKLEPMPQRKYDWSSWFLLERKFKEEQNIMFSWSSIPPASWTAKTTKTTKTTKQPRTTSAKQQEQYKRQEARVNMWIKTAPCSTQVKPQVCKPKLAYELAVGD